MRPEPLDNDMIVEGIAVQGHADVPLPVILPRPTTPLPIKVFEHADPVFALMPGGRLIRRTTDLVIRTDRNGRDFTYTIPMTPKQWELLPEWDERYIFGVHVPKHLCVKSKVSRIVSYVPRLTKDYYAVARNEPVLGQPSWCHYPARLLV